MTKLPEYENPPVKEVVCGVLFQPMEGFLAPHLGLLWEKFKDEYPECRHVPLLAPVVERFGESAKVQVQLSDVPPLPRIWFVHAQQNGIIQVQQDRFHHNWRKVRADDEYPRYGKVMSMFRAHWQTFVSFVEEQGIGTISPLQYEITYVNEVRRGEAWESIGQIGGIFPDFSWRGDQGRFLKEPESVNFRLAFRLPRDAGRLHVAVRSAKRREDQADVLLLELTARGITEGTTPERMWDWYDMAHEWIVRSFADLTSHEIQKSVWRRLE